MYPSGPEIETTFAPSSFNFFATPHDTLPKPDNANVVPASFFPIDSNNSSVK